MDTQLLDAWAIHDRINRYLLDAVAPEALGSKIRRGRTVGEQFAHLHNVRCMWLEQAAPELLDGVGKIEKDGAGNAAVLRRALEASGAAVGVLLREATENGGRVRGFKPHMGAFLGYLISHESHHRGQIALTLKQAGFPLDKKVAYGLWDWGNR